MPKVKAEKKSRQHQEVKNQGMSACEHTEESWALKQSLSCRDFVTKLMRITAVTSVDGVNIRCVFTSVFELCL